jgi:hypothetical protein
MPATTQISLEQLEGQYGGDLVFLFKGSAPFTPSKDKPHIPMGVVLSREEDGRVLCYECEEWYDNVLSHVNHHHKMDTKEYREKYGLNRWTPLTSRRTSKKMAESRKARAAKQGKVMKKVWAEFRRTGRSPHPKGQKMSVQYRNQYNTCPAQLRGRMELLAAKVGRSPVISDAREHDPTLETSIKHYFGRWNEAKKAFGFDVIKQGDSGVQAKKQEADLIYAVRAYVGQHGKLPWRAGARKNPKEFEHSNAVYARRWGSYRRAWAACGIAYDTDTREWVVIN